MIQEKSLLKRDELYETLRSAIRNGEYQHGLQLPSETQLSQDLKTSRETLRAAFKKLEAEGLLLRVRPKGTFVNAPFQQRRLIVALVQPGNDLSEPRNYIIPGIQQAAIELGYEFELCPTSFVNEALSLSSELAGFVIFGGFYSGNEDYIQFLQKSGCPVVMAACHRFDQQTTGFAALRPDRRQAWCDGILALKAAGHRRIATFSTPLLQGFRKDYDDYRQFLQQEGLYLPELIVYPDYNYHSVHDNLHKLMRSGKAPTAIMCYSDFFALHLFRAAKELQYRIPEDICVMGFSGYPGARFLNPPLATVDLNYFAMGRKVVELLSRSPEWFQVPGVAVPEIVIPHKVIMRKSAMLRRLESSF